MTADTRHISITTSIRVLTAASGRGEGGRVVHRFARLVTQLQHLSTAHAKDTAPLWELLPRLVTLLPRHTRRALLPVVAKLFPPHSKLDGWW